MEPDWRDYMLEAMDPEARWEWLTEEEQQEWLAAENPETEDEEEEDPQSDAEETSLDADSITAAAVPAPLTAGALQALQQDLQEHGEGEETASDRSGPGRSDATTVPGRTSRPVCVAPGCNFSSKEAR